jgi:hypothetical protein
MPTWQWAILIGWGSVSSVWGVILLIQRRICLDGLLLKPLGPDAPAPTATGGAWPGVTVVIPARNEAKTIAGCLGRVLAQHYPDLSVTVVDDRSEDDTAAIVEAIAETDPRVRVIKITDRPPDWVGKSYALWQGSAATTTPWLLFIDADCELEPEAVKTAVAQAIRRDAHMLTLWPRNAAKGFWEHMMIPLCCGIIALWFGLRRLNQPDGPAFANGQFILIRTDAYRQIDGHRAIRGYLGEDVALAASVKQAGLNRWVGAGRDLVGVRMFNGYRETRDGWVRIFTVSLCSATKALLSVAWLAFGSLLPFVGAVVIPVALLSPGMDASRPWWWMLAGVCAGHLTTMSIVSYQFWGMGHCDRRYLWLYPVSVLLVIDIMMRVWWCQAVRRSVVWRATRYPIDRLGRIRPPAYR